MALMTPKSNMNPALLQMARRRMQGGGGPGSNPAMNPMAGLNMPPPGGSDSMSPPMGMPSGPLGGPQLNPAMGGMPSASPGIAPPSASPGIGMPPSGSPGVIGAVPVVGMPGGDGQEPDQDDMMDREQLIQMLKDRMRNKYGGGGGPEMGGGMRPMEY